MRSAAFSFAEEDLHAQSVRETDEPSDISAEPADRDAADIEYTIPEQVRAEEPFRRWFGTADLTLITFRGELGPSRIPEHEHELYINGEPVSNALSAEDRAYYAEVFLQELYATGRAAWRGVQTPEGLVLNGTEAVQTPEGIRLTFAERVETPRERAETTTEPPSHNEDTPYQAPEDVLAEPIPLALDEFMTEGNP